MRALLIGLALLLPVLAFAQTQCATKADLDALEMRLMRVLVLQPVRYKFCYLREGGKLHCKEKPRLLPVWEGNS